MATFVTTLDTLEIDPAYSNGRLHTVTEPTLTITDYTGLDPEVQETAGNFGSREFLTQGQVRSFTARLQVTF